MKETCTKQQQILKIMLDYFILLCDPFYFIFALTELECNRCTFELCLSFSYLKLVFLTLFSLGWNRRFKRRILRSHRNVWAFIKSLKKSEVVFRQLMLNFMRTMKSIGNNILKSFHFS
jgi:hypothetical protein